jgi:hypothetical protein
MRWRLWIPAGLGTLTVLGAAAVGLVSDAPPGGEVPLLLAGVVGVAVLVLSLVKLVRDPGDESVAPPPWTEDGTLVEGRPESTPEADRISGTGLAEEIEAAASELSGSETLDDGIESVRQPLRDALVGTLRQSGWTDEDIEATLSDGSWTSDRTAAALLDDAVEPPERSLRRRIWAWLFPERALRHRTALAVGAIARVAESELPPVVGQHAPRPVPVLEPTLSDLQRAADGELRQAVEGSAAIGTFVTDGKSVAEESESPTASEPGVTE